MCVKSRIVALCCLINNILHAQVGNTLWDVGYAQIGTYNKIPAHALLAGTNQALLPHFKTFTVTALGENRFLLNDLSNFKLGVVLPVKEGAFGMQAGVFGSAEHYNSSLGLSYGRQLNDRLQVGVQFNYLQYHLSGYGNLVSVNAEAGIVYQVSEAVKGGLHIYNPTAQTYYGLKEAAIPRVVSVGLGYAPSELFSSSIMLLKASNQTLNLQVALQYQMLQKLVVKGGLTTGSSQYYIGAGYALGNLQLEAFTSIHPQLAVSPGLMITYKKLD